MPPNEASIDVAPDSSNTANPLTPLPLLFPRAIPKKIYSCRRSYPCRMPKLSSDAARQSSCPFIPRKALSSSLVLSALLNSHPMLPLVGSLSNLFHSQRNSHPCCPPCRRYYACCRLPALLSIPLVKNSHPLRPLADSVIHSI